MPTSISATGTTGRTRIGAPSRYAAPPSVAVNSVPVATFSTIPATTSPSCSAAIETAYCGMP